jgi:hypothetical protein
MSKRFQKKIVRRVFADVLMIRLAFRRALADADFAKKTA